jgi:squalene-associated FAD-dependent desaturase
MTIAINGTHNGDRSRGVRVAVVGGGLAGITAALDCAELGAQVTLLESRPRLGGAAYSVERHGLHVDNGQHVFLRCCTAYRGLLRRLGALDAVRLQPRLEIPVLAPGRATLWLRRSNLPAPAHVAPSLMTYKLLSIAERISVARAMAALRHVDPEDPAADCRRFGDWLREHGQNDHAVERLWGLIGRPTLNLAPEEASLAQAAYVFKTALLESAPAGDVGWARVPLSAIHDVAARCALSRAGVEIHTRRRAEAISRDEGGHFEIEVSAGPTLHTDAVVLAVPHDRVPGILPSGANVPAGIENLGTSPIVNLHVVYDRRVLEYPFAAGADTPVQWVFDRTESSGLATGQYLAVSLSAAEVESRMTVDELRERFIQALSELLPAARSATVQRFFVTREHTATFRATPGARAFRPGPQTSVPGLALAGSWTNTGWPATMEGAVRSGAAAAREAIASLAAAAPITARLAAA